METAHSDTSPQGAEGITACQWVDYGAASSAISYANARLVLRRAQAMITGVHSDEPESTGDQQLGLALEPVDEDVK